mmetsp:Transcript_20787/g.58075  ORF Transcript_20787/g.58075 Transcript_20787/m.58075 type:complete len:134 (-) Transcript_20787:27-428(-)
MPTFLNMVTFSAGPVFGESLGALAECIRPVRAEGGSGGPRSGRLWQPEAKLLSEHCDDGGRNGPVPFPRLLQLRALPALVMSAPVRCSRDGGFNSPPPCTGCSIIIIAAQKGMSGRPNAPYYATATIAYRGWL